MLINLMGCDGSGKTTQLELVKPWIEATFACGVREIKKRDLFDPVLFPESSRFFGCSYRELMYEILPEMEPTCRALFLFYMLAASTSRYPIRSDEVVLLDGGWQKHVATEAAMGVDFAWLSAVTQCFPRSDLTIFLDIEPDIIVERRRQNNYGAHAPYECGCEGDVSDEAFVRQMSATRRWMKHLAGTEGWIAVDASQPRQDTFDEITRWIGPAIAASLGRQGHAQAQRGPSTTNR
jgi:thymidylate kinase